MKWRTFKWKNRPTLFRTIIQRRKKNEEKIAIATAMNNGGVKAPDELFHTTR